MPRTTPSPRPTKGQRRTSVPTTPDTTFNEIRALAASLHALHNRMVANYAPIVQDMIRSRCREQTQIQRTLDRLLDCACIPEGLALFKSLCRYYYTLNPAATASYVHAYRDMWDREEPEEEEAS